MWGLLGMAMAGCKMTPDGRRLLFNGGEPRRSGSVSFAGHFGIGGNLYNSVSIQSLSPLFWILGFWRSFCGDGSRFILRGP